MRPNMGATINDVTGLLSVRMRDLVAVRSAFVTVDPTDDRQMRAWALLNDGDEETETALIGIEQEAYGKFGNDLHICIRTIYLRGRDPASLVPPDAHIVRLRAA